MWSRNRKTSDAKAIMCMSGINNPEITTPEGNFDTFGPLLKIDLTKFMTLTSK